MYHFTSQTVHALCSSLMYSPNSLWHLGHSIIKSAGSLSVFVSTLWFFSFASATSAHRPPQWGHFSLGIFRLLSLVCNFFSCSYSRSLITFTATPCITICCGHISLYRLFSAWRTGLSFFASNTSLLSVL